MGTMFRVVFYTEGAESARNAMAAAFARARELDDRLSDYKPGSELNRLCRAGRAAVGEDLFTVLWVAQRVSQESNGAFDVTVGPVVQLWREARKRGVLPSDGDRRNALAKVGWHHVRLKPVNREVVLGKRGMQLDLGGIAKGYAGDEMLRVLRDLGVQRALVAAGGDIVAGDPPPGAKGWRVGVRGGVLDLANGAVSTSGDSEQFVEIAGTSYSHIVDPRTGLALVGSIQVSVTAPTGIVADAWATALRVKGVGGTTEAPPGLNSRSKR